MKTYFSIAAVVLRSQVLSRAAAAFALVACVNLPVSAVPAQAQAAPTSDSGYCPLIKNDKARALCMTARSQFKNHERNAALQTMRSAQAAAPQEGVPYALVGIIQINTGNFSAAESALRAALAKNAPRNLVLPVLFHTMIAQHKQTRLLQEFPDPPAGAHDEEAMLTLSGRAKALQSLGRLNDAAAAADRALAIRRNVSNLTLRAEIAALKYDYKLRDSLVDAAYQLDPKDPIAKHSKLRQLQAAGNAQQTLAYTAMLLKADPNDLDAQLARIDTFFKQKQFSNMEAETNALLAKTPKSDFGLFFKALLMARTDKRQAWEMMQGLREGFISQNPSLVLPAVQLANDAGYPSMGEEILGKAISATPTFVDGRVRLAEIRLSQSNPGSAVTLLMPIQESPDKRVQKLLAEARGQIMERRGSR